MPIINTTFSKLGEVRPYMDLGTFDNSRDLYYLAEHIGGLMGVHFDTDDIITQIQRNREAPQDVPIDKALNRDFVFDSTPIGYRAVAVNRRRPNNNYKPDRGSVISYAEIADLEDGKSASRIRTLYAELAPRAIRASLSSLVVHSSSAELSARIHLPETAKVFASHPKTDYAKSIS